jgi:hypothetical protein
MEIQLSDIMTSCANESAPTKLVIFEVPSHPNEACQVLSCKSV